MLYLENQERYGIAVPYSAIGGYSAWATTPLSPHLLHAHLLRQPNWCGNLQMQRFFCSNFSEVCFRIPGTSQKVLCHALDSALLCLIGYTYRVFLFLLFGLIGRMYGIMYSTSHVYVMQNHWAIACQFWGAFQTKSLTIYVVYLWTSYGAINSPCSWKTNSPE